MASAAVSSTSGHGPAFQDKPVPVLQSSTTKNTGPRNVRTTLNYYKDLGNGSTPEPSYVGRPETYERPVETANVTITDISGNEDKYSLDGNGFQIYPHVSEEKDFLDDEKIKREYYPETEQLLKDATGATRIFIFDHTIRRATADSRVTPQSLRRPVRRVHIDQSYTAAANRVSHHLPDLAPALLQSRYQIINVWRPIRRVQRDPLAIADAHSVPDSDLVPVKLIYPDREGETYMVRPNPAHRWFYKAGLGPEEVILIKCFDSETDGRARRVPHSAFEIAGMGEEVEGRESIEVRALVFC